MVGQNTGSIAAVVVGAVSLLATLTIGPLESPDHVRLTAEFRECYSDWRPEDGVRSPCPQLQNSLNVALLERNNLFGAGADQVMRLTGRPRTIYLHHSHPEIACWKTRSYWVTMAPKCVMLLPRNPEYDGMMAMFVAESANRIAALPPHSASSAVAGVPAESP